MFVSSCWYTLAASRFLCFVWNLFLWILVCGSISCKKIKSTYLASICFLDLPLPTHPARKQTNKQKHKMRNIPIVKAADSSVSTDFFTLFTQMLKKLLACPAPNLKTGKISKIWKLGKISTVQKYTSHNFQIKKKFCFCFVLFFLFRIFRL